MREFLRRVLRAVGLLGLPQRIKRALHAQGWFDWEPLVPHDDFSKSCDMAIAALRTDGHAFGDYLEFGVSRGTSMSCMYKALRRAGLSEVRLFGFDSFQGMPEEAAEQGWRPGLYHSTIGATRRYLADAGVDVAKVKLIKGWFRDTLTPEIVRSEGLEKASLIMVDCDIYSASRQALWFAEPLIRDQAVVIFDDWGWQEQKGEIGQKEAWEEFLAAFPQFEVEALPAYIPQARVFLLTRQAVAPASSADAA